MIGSKTYRIYVNKSTIFVLTYILSSLCLSAYAGPSNDFAKGVEAYSKGRYSIALRHLTSAEQQYSNNALLHYYRANTLVHLSKMPEATTEYTKASELDPYGATGNSARKALHAAGAQTAKTPSVFHTTVSATQQPLLEQANERSAYLLQHGQQRSTSRLQNGQDQSAQIRSKQSITKYQ